jgi:hypothetical protein
MSLRQLAFPIAQKFGKVARFVFRFRLHCGCGISHDGSRRFGNTSDYLCNLDSVSNSVVPPIFFLYGHRQLMWFENIQ